VGMNMSQSIHEFMLSLDFDPKLVNNLKSKQKIKLIGGYYGFRSIGELKKQNSKDFLNEFIRLKNKDAESFKILYEKYTRDQMITTGTRYDLVDEHILTICNLPANKFYESKEWQSLRYKVLKNHGNRCFCCGRSPKDRVVIHVDHILPRSIYPEHALRYSNMQVLCKECNLAKSNTDETSWIGT